MTGPEQTEEVLRLVHENLPRPHEPFGDLVPAGGVLLTPKHYAYLKIAEGCNHHCTFCIIPSLRGPLVSRPIGSVIREASNLVKSGVKELLVIAQDTAAYGQDVKYKLDFIGGRTVKTNIKVLFEELGKLGVWVRPHYMYPYASVDEIVPLMAEGKILPYLDVPFQHAHSRILKAMKRPGSEYNMERINAWRAICPDITIRSTFITGFPGETDEEFQYLWTSSKKLVSTELAVLLTLRLKARLPTIYPELFRKAFAWKEENVSWKFRAKSLKNFCEKKSVRRSKS